MHLIAELEAAAACGFSPRFVANPLPSKRTARRVATDFWARAGVFIRNVYFALRGRMIVYATGQAAQTIAAQRIYVRPGVTETGEGPAEWYEDEAKTQARQFQVVFQFGKADVPDSLGKWLVARGMAKRSRLIVPAGAHLLSAER